jgi:hypothetical protein
MSIESGYVETSMSFVELEFEEIKASIHKEMRCFLEGGGKSNWHAWVGEVERGGGVEEINKFKDLLVKIDEDTVRKMFNNYRTMEGRYLYDDCVKGFLNYYKIKHSLRAKPKLLKKSDLALIVDFLAYTLVVERPVTNYVDRIDRYFGWNKFRFGAVDLK